MLKDNLEAVQLKIAEALKRSAKSPQGLTLIAVSKTRPSDMVQEVYDMGVRDFGENKVQELAAKYDALPKDIRWHFIGHLQRNKVKYIVDKVYMIHSVDSFRLAEEISKEAVRKGITVRVLLEVNVADEDSKFGIAPEAALELTQKCAVLPGLIVCGLMTVAPETDNQEENRVYFKALNNLCVDITNKNIDNVYMDSLSMGMTGDYETAIEEGASFVRVGTGIFGKRDYSAT